MFRASIALVIALAAAPASAQRVSGELRAGGGYDSNPALASDASNRRGQTVISSMGAGVFRIGGFAAGRIGDPLGGSARFDLDGRVFESGDVMFFERLAIEGAYRIDEMRLRCAVDGSRFDATLTLDDAFGAGARCGVVAELPYGFHVTADLDGGARIFDAGQLDGLFGGEVAAGWTWEFVALDLGLAVLRRESDNADATRVDVAPWVAVRVETPYIGGRVGYRLVARRFDLDADYDGDEHTGRAEVWGMPLPWIGAYVDVELGYASGGSQALVYQRVQVTAGVRVVLDWQPEVAALPDAPATQGPATVGPNGVQFSFFFPDAERVSIVGDWNDWTEEELTKSADGHFEGFSRIPPGRHVYHLLIDGEPHRPPGAARYQRDDFGSQNAVVDIP